MTYNLMKVRKELEKAGSRFVLEIASLEIMAGEFVAFVGQSGCGKTTLLDLLGLISTPSSAERFHLGFEPGQFESVLGAGEARLAELRRSHLGYVLQSGGLLPFLSVGENILLPCRANGAFDITDVQRLADQLGIVDHWNKKPAFLSGGQRQRVAIARALAHRPGILLADEPTGAVDQVTAREIRTLLKLAARDRGATVLVVTHDESLVSGLTDRVFSFSVERHGENEVVSALFETTWADRVAGGFNGWA
jgi:putative ABC transport system ATP-binding protein